MKQKSLDKFNEVMEKIDYTNFYRNNECKFDINQVILSKHEIYVFVQRVFKTNELKFRTYHLRFDNLKSVLSISSYNPKPRHYLKNI